MVIRSRKSAKRAAIAVAYIRASTDEQKLSPDAQRAAVEAWATREGVHVASWHVDAGVCSVDAIDERPALLAALAALREHRAAYLVVARRDRLARDVVLTAMIERQVERVGAQVVSAAGEGNGSTPADAFMRTVIDGAAQYERALIRARTKVALAAKRAKGEKTGGEAPFGYQVAPDGVHLVEHAAEQLTIARALALSDAGLPVRRLAETLAAEGHRNRAGRPLAFQTIAKLVRAVLVAREAA
jgi:DNA invertase Pin-like site-specific DNA recombinase